MIAGEQKLLVFWANPQAPVNPPTSPLSFAGATVILWIVSPKGILSTVSMTVSATDPNPMNHFAYYRTLNTDFPVGGVYSLQPEGTFPDGSILKLSPVYKMNVGDSLG